MFRGTTLFSNKGFSLVELSIVILISGILLLMVLKFAVPLYEKTRRLETAEKLKAINQAIESYALHNYRIPCPADPRTTPAGGEPFGTERFSGANGDTLPANCSAAAGNWEGAVPFKTLGIPERTIRDGWGNYFTYVISPAFAVDPSDPAILVHPVCRTMDWYYPRDNSSTLAHKNPRKARFCCASAPDVASNNIYNFNTDITIRLRNGGVLTDVLSTGAPRNASGNGSPNACSSNPCEAYATTDEVFTRTPNVTVPVTDVSTGIAFALISHGSNGFGAYSANGTQTSPGAGGADEIENADNDRIFIERTDISENSADYYDDIMLWRTQDLIFIEQGESCVRP